MCGGYKKGENPSERGKNKIQWITDLPAGLRGRVILGKGNDMEELIKRLERVIATGASDKDGMHPISAEAVLEVVKQLSEHGTNLAEVGTDCISRRSAIDALRAMQTYKLFAGDDMLLIDQAGAMTELMLLPSAHPEIIRCRECKFASGDSRICMKFDHSPIGELDFCSFAERREVTT